MARRPGGEEKERTVERRTFLAALGALGCARALAAAPATAQPEPWPATRRPPDVIFVPTPEEVVEKMLAMARVTAKDVVYDLGCGDGRIVIAAARKYGARGVGIDIDPDRIAEATENAEKAGVADRVSFVQGDLFEADISPATVVTLYLLTELNLKLRPKLLKELRPGARVVSHAFGMGDWKPERTEHVGNVAVHLWRIPPRAANRQGGA
jgi:SAM-dependent methyltransferase